MNAASLSNVLKKRNMPFLSLVSSATGWEMVSLDGKWWWAIWDCEDRSNLPQMSESKRSQVVKIQVCTCLSDRFSPLHPGLKATEWGHHTSPGMLMPGLSLERETRIYLIEASAIRDLFSGIWIHITNIRKEWKSTESHVIEKVLLKFSLCKVSDAKESSTF